MMRPTIPPLPNAEQHPGSQHDVLDGLGGEPLADSGFEAEQLEQDLDERS
jgi:hypothetical protein